ncbi:hypothetical protein ACFE04_029796 [Oxalis oulophora]
MAFTNAYSIGNDQVVAEKISVDPVLSKTAQSTVTCVYQTHIANSWKNVTFLWCRNLMNHTLNVMVHSSEGEMQHSCKVDVKSWHFWSKKGMKSFEIDGSQVNLYWDLHSAKFCASPEPIADYYVALVAGQEVLLLLGDLKKKVYKRTKARPALVDPILFFKKENVFAKKSFSSRAKFDERRKEHDIVVESSTSGPRDPEMWISIDGIVLIHVKNLQWKFRGNQTVLVDNQQVQVFWDVHDWLFSSVGPCQGLFIFKPGSVEAESDREGSSRGGYDSTCSETTSTYYSTAGAPEFCLFLQAWKLE